MMLCIYRYAVYIDDEFYIDDAVYTDGVGYIDDADDVA